MRADRYISGNFLRDGVLIVLAAIAVTVPIYLWGIPYGNDMPQHFQFALQYENSIANGVLYPSWAVEANGGLGDVGIRFYPQLPYYALVFFKTIAGGWYLGSTLTFGFWFLLGGLGVYWLAREWFDSESSVVAAILFTLLPYHVNQIYNAFFYAEFAGLGVLPFCFLFVRRVISRKDLASIVGLAISLAALVLTHLPTAVMGSVALAVFAFAELWSDRSPRALLGLASAGVLGAAASSFYWIKLVTELAFVSHSVDEFTKTTFDFKSNFLAAYFYVGSDDYVSRSLWFADMLFFLTLAIIVGSIAFRRLGDKSKQTTIFSIICVAAVCTFLATPLSAPVWQNFEPLQKIQFPFRFLGAISIFASVLAASAIRSVVDIAATKYRPLAIIFIGLVFITVAFSFAQVIRPAIYRDAPAFQAVLSGRAEAKSCECWWPVWAKETALAQPSTEAAETIPLVINGVERGKAPVIADVANIFYYPHWKLAANGSTVDVSSDESGRIKLPSSPTDAKLEFIEPKVVRTSQIVSAAMWPILLVLAAASVVLEKRKSIQKIAQ